jgi:non-ribosomal peptide synthetase component E (peptide arylation enzyme)
MNANVGSFLHRWAQQDPERTGIVDSGRDDLVLSYAELDRQASRVGAHLCERGLSL